ncbi:MAG: DUF45 domain-containing protein [Mycoplasmataceae bacterium]|nr:DUF45 domain-containing protein [Mycoplasmataceae bacterium]
MYKLGFYVNKKIIYVNVIETTNKNMYLKVVGKDIVAYAPKRTREKTVNKFISEHIENFSKHINNESRVELYSIKETFILIGGIKYDFTILTGFKTNSLIIKGTKAYVNCKTGTDKEIEDAIKMFLKKQLDKYLKTALYKIEKQMNLKDHVYKIVYKKSTWGTNMIGRKSISFSSRLAHFKNEVIDYVIIHELAHTIEPNHSSAFWEVVNQYCPDVKGPKKILKDSI